MKKEIKFTTICHTDYINSEGLKLSKGKYYDVIKTDNTYIVSLGEKKSLLFSSDYHIHAELLYPKHLYTYEQMRDVKLTNILDGK